MQCGKVRNTGYIFKIRNYDWLIWKRWSLAEALESVSKRERLLYWNALLDPRGTVCDCTKAEAMSAGDESEEESL